MPDEGAQRNVAGTLSAIAGLIVVLAGILTVFVIALVSLKALDQESSQVALATSAFGVIGTIVGAYFGLKIARRAKSKPSAPARPSRSRCRNSLRASIRTSIARRWQARTEGSRG